MAGMMFYTAAQAPILSGGLGADIFDCGLGADEILEFNPTQGDLKTNNRE